MRNFKTLLGIVVGITGVLLLTLNYWGNTWWQIAISLLVGILVGVTIADHKEFFRILRSATEKIFKSLSEKIRKIKFRSIIYNIIVSKVFLCLFYFLVLIV